MGGFDRVGFLDRDGLYQMMPHAFAKDLVIVAFTAQDQSVTRASNHTSEFQST
jgi:hypothetical protein